MRLVGLPTRPSKELFRGCGVLPAEDPSSGSRKRARDLPTSSLTGQLHLGLRPEQTPLIRDAVSASELLAAGS